MKRYAAAALIAAFLVCPLARAADAPAKPAIDWSAKIASPITKDVKAACESKDPAALAYCYGILMGLYDSNFYMADALDSQGLCIPESTTAEQMRAAFLDRTNKEADQTLGPIAIFYYSAMNTEFPCPQQPQAAQPKK